MFNEDFHEVEVWVPHRISGFFQMMDPKVPRPDDPTQIGSRGAGPSLNAFGKTKIIKNNGSNKNKIANNGSFSVFINDIDCSIEAKTSLTVIQQMENLLPKNSNFIISHKFDLPLGCGYGSSAAGALGIVYGLNALYRLGLSAKNAAKYAHIAEVLNHTGLGTVGGQMEGGLSVSLGYGYPFLTDRIPLPPDTQIVLGSFGPISTKNILTDLEYRRIIHDVGKKAMERLQQQYSLQNFMDTCKFFIQETYLLDRLNLPLLKDLIIQLYKLPIYGASMNQLGKSVFCVCHNQIRSQVEEIFKSYSPNYVLETVDICETGPSLHSLK
jgi:pantoate kinase